MLLTVGELATRCGLTVRTLHHYDAIGLLAPSLRSDAGYRLYDRRCIERLHRIQALRHLGLSLTDIDTALSGPQRPLAEVVERQIAQIDQELAQATRLRQRLVVLRTQLADGQSPDLADWLDTLELMTMYEKYFSPEELDQLPFHHDADVQAQADDPPVQQLARRWMALFCTYAGDDPATHARIREAYANEPDLRSGSAVDQALFGYVRDALDGMREKQGAR